MDAPHVTLLILTWNDCEAVTRCLESVRQLAYPNFDVLLVDNASTDATVVSVNARFPDCDVIVNAENLGFSAGCDVGLEQVLVGQSVYVLLLNQDTLVSPGLLDELVGFAERNPRAGILGAKTYSTNAMADGAPRLLYSGAWRSYVPLRQRIPGINGPDTGHHDTPQSVDYVWGHGMLIRTELLHTIGLFDPGYFFYYEDLDLCRRASAAGYELWYVPSAILWHDADDGERASDSERWRWKHKADSIRYFHRKYYGEIAGPLLTAFTVLDMSLRMAIRGRGLAATHFLSAFLPGANGRTRGDPAGPPDAT